ncbi:MAG: aspartyl-tRNA(Asn)/glutamyl-tRNA(Gln) amidotransferase subunit [Burkholderiales bacterium]|jgi:Asp-tRNA(Asn)/Glu-tRNA(Gln) amidotransferase A subunit family amidase
MDEALKREAERILKADRFGAFVAVRPDPSFVRAAPLRGAWLAVKDNISVAGLPFTAGLPVFAKRIATEDAEAVRRLRLAGGRVAGVTQTDAAGFGVTTPAVTNPMAPGLAVGGSSGGSAAAVAAGLADIGLGTDTGGSVRIPAACCSLFAFKPTHGLVPLDGVWPMAPGLDHVGLLTRYFDTLVCAAGALLGESGPVHVEQPRFGVDMTRIPYLDHAVARSFLATIERLREAGFGITPVVLPDRDTISAAHGTLVLAQARAVYASLWSTDPAALGSTVHRALAIGYQLDEATVERAQASATKIVAEVNRVFSSVDAILTPTLPVPPPPVGARSVMLNGHKMPAVTVLLAETCIANLTGCPALVLPLATGVGNQSVSIQILAPPNKDAALLRYGAWLTPMFAAQMAGA